MHLDSSQGKGGPPPAQLPLQLEPADKDAGERELVDAAVSISHHEPPLPLTSIYDYRNQRQRTAILLAVSFSSILLPVTDTIYLPALHSVAQDLQTTETLAASTMAVYMFMIGASALLLGPFSDRYGRRLTYLICGLTFIATSVICIFSPNIAFLIAFRALQGCAVTGYMVIGNAVIADIFPPEQRGRAAGVFMVPMLVGPICGPLLGGVLSQTWGWRSCFAALAVLGALAMLAKALVLREETHQYHVLKLVRSRSGDLVANSLKEAGSISKPVFAAPWKPIGMLFEPSIAPYAAAALLNFSTMFASLMVLPVLLSAPPYNLSASLVGVAYLPVGLGGFLTSFAGGRLADGAAGRWQGLPEGRLLPGTLGAMGLMPSSLLVYGWTLHHHSSLAGPLVAHFFVGVALSLYFPAIFSYLTVVKQQQAGAVSAAVQGMMFILSAVFILASLPVLQSIGIGPFMSILAGMVLASFAASAAIILSKLCRAGTPCNSSSSSSSSFGGGGGGGGGGSAS